MRRFLADHKPMVACVAYNAAAVLAIGVRMAINPEGSRQLLHMAAWLAVVAIVVNGLGFSASKIGQFISFKMPGKQEQTLTAKP